MIVALRRSRFHRIAVIVVLIIFTSFAIGQTNTDGMPQKTARASLVAVLAMAFGVGAIVGIGEYSLSTLARGERWECSDAVNALVYGGVFAAVLCAIVILAPVFLGSTGAALAFIAEIYGIADSQSAGTLSNGIVTLINSRFNLGQYVCSQPPSFWISTLLAAQPSSFGLSLVYNQINKELDPFFQDLATHIETKTTVLPASDLILTFDSPGTSGTPYSGDILLAVSFRQFVPPSEIEYVEFQYSFDKLEWKTVIGHYDNTSYPGKDYQGTDGWCLLFGTGPLFNDIAEAPTVWFRARAKHRNSYTSGPWSVTSSPISIRNQFDHDYGVTNIRTDIANPVENDRVTISADVVNRGTHGESSGQQVSLFVDDALVTTTTTTPSLGPDASFTVRLGWNAARGAHDARISVSLTGDQNPSNNSTQVSLRVGVKGDLLIDGTNAPQKEHSVGRGESMKTSLTLQNTGSESISISVTTSGAAAARISLSDQSIVLHESESATFQYTITVPSSASIGSVEDGIMSFRYGLSTVDVPVRIAVIDNSKGSFRAILESGNVIIDGANRTITTGWFYDPSVYPFTLDNYASTSHPTDVSKSVSLSEGDYLTLNESILRLTADEQEGSASLRASIRQTSETGSKSFTSSQNDISVPITSWWRAGSNTVKLALDNFTHNANNVTWRIRDARWLLYISKNAWSKALSVSQNTLDLWKAGLRSARVYFTVRSVTQPGDLLLFNMGKQVDDADVSSSDAGRRRYFTLSSSELTADNAFIVRGSRADATHAAIEDVSLEVEYFTGEPLLMCEKVITGDPHIGGAFMVTLTLKNVGSNIADEPRFTDIVPAGFTVTQGSTNGNLDDINPGDSTRIEYWLVPDTVGHLVLPPFSSTYRSGTKTYSASSQSLPVVVTGGRMNVTIAANKSEIDLDDSLTIECTVSAAHGGATIGDADVYCTLYPPAGDSSMFPVYRDPRTLHYRRTLPSPRSLGLYRAIATAVRSHYQTSVSQDTTSFDVVNLAPPPAILGDSVLRTTDSSVIVACKVDGGTNATGWGVAYGIDTLSWSYSALRPVSGFPPGVLDSTAIGPLRDGTRYSVSPFAVSRGGHTSGRIHRVTTPLPSPKHVKFLVTADLHVQLTWEDSCRWEKGFIIQRAHTPEGPYAALDTVLAGKTFFTDSAVTPRQNYSYRVLAFTTDTISSPSHVVSLSVVTALSSERDVPIWYSLSQNYPNPFNPTSVIRYGVPQRSHVTLEVFNILGQLVAVLQNGVAEAGYHDARFDGTSLPSGVYIYRMQADHYMAALKLLLVK